MQAGRRDVLETRSKQFAVSRKPVFPPFTANLGNQEKRLSNVRSARFLERVRQPQDLPFAKRRPEDLQTHR